MNVAGVTLTLNFAGSPAALELISQLRNVEVVVTDDEKSGFQIVFEVGRAARSTTGYDLPGNASLQPFTRVNIAVQYDNTTTLLIDGIILHGQVSPGKSPNGALFTVTGEDVSVMMDLTQKIKAFKGMDEGTIATTILGDYSQYASPSVKDPPVKTQPDPNVYVPIQRGTDRAYLQELAARFGYRFYIKFGQSPSDNAAYWGPPELSGDPQPPIMVDLGPLTNCGKLETYYDALAPKTVVASVQDRTTDVISPISVTSVSSSLKQLSSSPAISSQTNVRQWLFERGEGRLQNEAQAWAQGQVDRSTYDVVRVEGELDPMRYGQVLLPRQLVTLAGAGATLDGTYYVKTVRHLLKQTEYKQRFTLTREGVNSSG